MRAVLEISPTPWTEPLDLTGQVVVVSGGSSGIGLEIAQQLDRRGCHVIIASRNAKRVQEAVNLLENGVGFPDCDVRDSQRVQALFDFVFDRFDSLDILIVCAGIGRSERTPPGLPRVVVKLEEFEWDDVIDTNLRGAFLMCRAATEIMIRQRAGQILNISSARGAIKGQPCGAGYSASKMAVLAMFRSLAAEVADFGIRVMTILPDAVNTSLISGTTLASRGALRSSDVGNYVAHMLSMPQDASLHEPVLAPLETRTRSNTKGAS